MDPRSQPYVIRGVSCTALVRCDEIGNEDVKEIAEVPWFVRSAVLADAAKAFVSLERYSWYGQFFWAEDSSCLRSRLWRDLYAIDECDLNTRGSHCVKQVEFVKNIRGGLASFGSTPLIGGRPDVDL